MPQEQTRTHTHESPHLPPHLHLASFQSVDVVRSTLAAMANGAATQVRMPPAKTQCAGTLQMGTPPPLHTPFLPPPCSVLGQLPHTLHTLPKAPGSLLICRGRRNPGMVARLQGNALGTQPSSLVGLSVPERNSSPLFITPGI